MADEDLVRFGTRVPAGLQRDVKSAAARLGIYVQDAVIQALREWLERHDK